MVERTRLPATWSCRGPCAKGLLPGGWYNRLYNANDPSRAADWLALRPAAAVPFGLRAVVQEGMRSALLEQVPGLELASHGSMKEPVDAAAVRIFPPAVPLLTILLGIALNRLCALKLKLSAFSRYGIGGGIVIGAVLGLGLYSVILLRRTGQSENPWTPTSEIVTRGPFRFTRNPLYLQMILGCIGLAIILRNSWILLLTPLAAWALQSLAIRPEEAYLERKFGESYRLYKRKVPRWLW